MDDGKSHRIPRCPENMPDRRDVNIDRPGSAPDPETQTFSDEALEQRLRGAVDSMIGETDAYAYEAAALWDLPAEPAAPDAWFLAGTESLSGPAKDTDHAAPSVHAPASRTISVSGTDSGPHRARFHSKLFRSLMTIAGAAACFLVILYFHARMTGSIPESGPFAGFWGNHPETGSAGATASPADSTAPDASGSGTSEDSDAPADPGKGEVTDPENKENDSSGKSSSREESSRTSERENRTDEDDREDDLEEDQDQDEDRDEDEDRDSDEDEDFDEDQDRDSDEDEDSDEEDEDSDEEDEDGDEEDEDSDEEDEDSDESRDEEEGRDSDEDEELDEDQDSNQDGDR